MVKIYYPYPANDGQHKYYIITKSGIDTPSWWSLKYLWSYPTKEEAYNHIKKDLKKWGVIQYSINMYIK